MSRPVAPSPISLGATLIGALAALVVLVGCSSSGHGGSATSAGPTTGTPPVSTPALASASVGDLTITGGYIPQPASPDVAAAYLTITNNGASADKLTKVTTSVTKSVMAMTESDTGGVGSMTDLTEVSIPAHGSMKFIPDHAHLMLEKPKPIKAGERVSMTLTFARAGTVQITLPVIPLLQTPTPTQAPSSMTMAPSDDMSMSGMTMSGS